MRSESWGCKKAFRFLALVTFKACLSYTSAPAGVPRVQEWLCWPGPSQGLSPWAARSWGTHRPCRAHGNTLQLALGAGVFHCVLFPPPIGDDAACYKMFNVS